MKLKISDSQKQQMNVIFANMKALRNDEKFMQMLKYANKHDLDKCLEGNDEEDVMELANFNENIVDTANNYFKWAIR